MPVLQLGNGKLVGGEQRAGLTRPDLKVLDLVPKLLLGRGGGRRGSRRRVRGRQARQRRSRFGSAHASRHNTIVRTPVQHRGPLLGLPLVARRIKGVHVQDTAPHSKGESGGPPSRGDSGALDWCRARGHGLQCLQESWNLSMMPRSAQRYEVVQANGSARHQRHYPIRAMQVQPHP